MEIGRKIEAEMQTATDEQSSEKLTCTGQRPVGISS